MLDVPATIAHLQAENERLYRRIITLEQANQTTQHTIIALEQYLTDSLSEIDMFHKLVENAPETIIIVGTDCRILYANPAGRELTGYGDALIGMYSDAIASDTPEAIVALRYELATEGFWRGELHYRHHDGRILTIQGVIFRINDTDGQFQAIAGMGHDNTNQQQAELSRRQLEQDVRHQQQFLRQILDINPNLIFTRNRAGQFTLVNQTLATIYGVQVEELLGKTDADLGLEEEGLAQLRREDDQIFKTGEEILIAERWIRDAAGQDRCISLVKRPVRSSDGTIDQVLVVATDITTSKLAEVALEQINDDLVRLVHELEQRNDEVAMLNEIGHFCMRSRTIQELYEGLGQFAIALFGGRPGGLYIYQAPSQELMAMAVWGTPTPSLHTLTDDTCQAVQQGQTCPAHVSNKTLCCDNPDAAFTTGYVCVPIIDQGETLGVFRQYLVSHSSPERAMQLAENITRYIGMTLTNLRLRARLREQATRDVLTGLFNRRYLDENLEREFAIAKRQQIQIGLMMIDIDHFKTINDTFGHKAGDAVLYTLGLFLQDNVRGSDIACRYGGEEFVLVLPQAGLENTRQRAESLRQRVQDLSIEYIGTTIPPITISIGIAMYPDHGSIPDDLLRAADEALYRAKTSGRNRVLVANPITDAASNGMPQNLHHNGTDT